MHNVIAEILNYLQAASRYKWLAAGLAWLICLFGWIYVSQMADKFQANARVHVDTRSVLRPLLTGLTIQPDVTGRIRLMSKLMFSRPNLEKVARMTDLDLGVKTDAAMEKLVNRLQSSMSIAGGESDLFTIGFQDPDPKVAKKVVQALLTIFVEQTLGESREDSNSAQKFLDMQIKEYEARLQQAEQNKEDFRRNNAGLIPGEGGSNLYGSLSGLTDTLEQTKMSLEEALRRRDSLRQQLQEENPYIPQDVKTVNGQTVSEKKPLTPLEERLQTLQGKLDDMMMKYTPVHPEVMALKKSIAELKRTKEKEDQAVKSLPQTSKEIDKEHPEKVAATNPVYQQKKLALGEIEANIASLTSRITMTESKISTLKLNLDKKLKTETELQNLNRDYSTLRENYSKLLERREQVRIAENVEQNTDSVKFKIVDPPQVPTEPSAPNRIVLSSVVLVAGIFVGLALALFMALLRPAYSSVQKLREATGVPVLGTVSMNWIANVRQQKWRQFLGFVASYAILLLVFAGVLALSSKGYHLPTFM